MYDSLADLIYGISPRKSPVMWWPRRVELSRNKGGTMRQRRRRWAKPVRVTGWWRLPEGLTLHKWID